MNIEKEVAAMKRMTVDQLRIKYQDVFGESTNGRNKDWLVKRIGWRLQANEEGDLSERARKRAIEIANDADVRSTPPRPRKQAADAPERTITKTMKVVHTNELLPGTKLKRVYKGETFSVSVLVDGFEFQGERFKSLTAVAKAITGKHWNGFHFFGLRRPRGAK